MLIRVLIGGEIIMLMSIILLLITIFHIKKYQTLNTITFLKQNNIPFVSGISTNDIDKTNIEPTITTNNNNSDKYTTIKLKYDKNCNNKIISKKVFCLVCNKDVKYHIVENEIETKYKGKKVKYIEQRAICNKCGNYVDVEGLEDKNLMNLIKNYNNIYNI